MKYFDTVSLDKNKRDNRFFAVSLIAVILLLTIFVDPRTVSVLACDFKNMTGHNCLTCGMSRSFYSFAQLDIPGAFKYHLLGPPLYLFLLLTLAKFSIELWTKTEYKTRISSLWRRVFFMVLILLWAGYWIAGLV